MSASFLAAEPCASCMQVDGNPVPRRSAFSWRHLLRQWRRRAAERHSLARFDDRMLRDIGLSRAEAQREYGKPFWRA